MKKILLPIALITVIGTTSSLFSSPHALNPSSSDGEKTRQLSEEILKHGQAFANLRSLVSGGSRLCGSSGAAHAVEWAQAKLESYGLDSVWLQPVKVPVWIRGDHEVAAVVVGASSQALRIAALGNSGGTPAGGVEAEVIEVKSLEEAQRLGSALKGKIVFYNRPMDPSLKDTFEAYSGAVDQRTSGPAMASRYGAVGALVRTVTTLTDDAHPHTGVTHFGTGSHVIPAAAISTHDANLLSNLLMDSHGGSVRVRLELSAHRQADTTSYNVIGELTGSELSREIVAVGGHLDSWDLAPAAHDDGAGVVQSIEVLRALKVLGIRPKRTVRAVLFMCEEFGGIGAFEYARQSQLRGERHLVATESDRGGFKPQGFAVQDPTGRGLARLHEWSAYLAPLQADWAAEGESGTDVEPLSDQGTVTFGLVTESAHYFDLHHSELDQLTAVDPQELQLGAAAMAVLTYLAAEQGI